MKRLSTALGLVGLAAAIALLLHAGLRPVAEALAAAGWPLLWLLPLHLLPLTLDAASWRVLLAPRDPQRRARLVVLLATAAVREAVNRLLPVAGVGGEVVGIRIVSRRGLPGAPVAASVVTEIVIAVGSVLLYAALGLVLLAAQRRDSAVLPPLLTGVLIALPVWLATFWLISNGRAASWLARFAARLFGGGDATPNWLASMQDLESELAALTRRRWRLAVAALLQLAGMVAGASEVWLALRLLGHPVSITAAVTIESLVLFVRNVAFAIPGALGAQEAAILLVAGALGLDQGVAAGLALAKRMREVLFGVPALIGWHLWESTSGWRAPDAKISSAR
jgi:putative membrane protein